MPNYAQEWQAVFKPYAQYSARYPANTYLAETISWISEQPLLANLNLMNQYYAELDNYEALARKVRRNPNDQALMHQLKSSEALLTGTNLLLTYSAAGKKALEVLAAIPEYLGTAQRTLKPGEEHRGYITNILKACMRISDQVLADLELYVTNTHSALKHIYDTAYAG